MILASILLVAAFAVLLHLLFALAVFALPVIVGLAAGWLAHGFGAGIVGSALAGLIAGTLALAAGQALFASARSPGSRLIVGALYALPAAALGFGLVYGVLAPTMPSVAWRTALALVGAIATGLTALRSVAALAPTVGSRAGEDGVITRLSA